MKSKIKKICSLLFTIGFIVTVAFLVKGVFLLHPYLGWAFVGILCMFIGYMIYDINS